MGGVRDDAGARAWAQASSAGRAMVGASARQALSAEQPTSRWAELDTTCEMVRMSSTAKGDKFEARVFTAVKRMISDGQFFCTPDACRVLRKRGYFSKDRDNEIIFDISVEIYIPGRSAYSVLILIECKDYGSPVPVNDAEEFFAKIDQVSGANVKGLIVSTNSFAQGTLQYCKSKGIGLARYYDKSTLKWILDRSPSSLSLTAPDWVDIQAGLMHETHQSRYFDFLSYVDGGFSQSLYVLFRSLLRDIPEADALIVSAEQLSRHQAPVVDRLDPRQIERRVEELLVDITYLGGVVSLESVCKLEASRTGLSVETDVVPGPEVMRAQILGRISFDPLKITVFSYPDRHPGRERFTLAHELGHHLLGHSKHMAGEYCQESDFERSGPSSLGFEDVVRMEWQANYFASSLLLPKGSFTSDFREVLSEFDVADRGHGSLYVDDQACNLRTFFAVTDVLRHTYAVSRQVVEFRLKKLGLLNDGRHGLRRLFER